MLIQGPDGGRLSEQHGNLTPGQAALEGGPVGPACFSRVQHSQFCLADSGTRLRLTGVTSCMVTQSRARGERHLQGHCSGVLPGLRGSRRRVPALRPSLPSPREPGPPCWTPWPLPQQFLSVVSPGSPLHRLALCPGPARPLAQRTTPGLLHSAQGIAHSRCSTNPW